MARKPVKPLPPPTMQERAAAATSARALDAALNGAPWGEETVSHIDFARPRRGLWIRRWSLLPGFHTCNGAYCHDLLPGWQYTRAELRSEMIPDLETLAESGVRPTESTQGDFLSNKTEA